MATYYHGRDDKFHSTFGAVSDKPHPDSPMRRAAVTVSYQHPRESTNFEEYRGRMVGEGFTGRQPNEQGQMFNYRRGQVHGAFADPTMKAHVPNVLGLVADYSKRLTGGLELPEPDSSLSRHSSRMVQHIRKKGVDLPQNAINPRSTVTNDLRFSTHWVPEALLHDPPSRIRALSSDEVNVGRRAIRDILRPPAAAPAAEPEAQTEGFRGRPKEGVAHQGALFSSRQLAATQRKAGFSPAATQRVTQPPKPQPSEGVEYHYGNDYSGGKRIMAMHPQHGVVGMISLSRRSWREQTGEGLGVDTRYLNRSAPPAMRSAVNETMTNVAHHQLGYTPQEGTYGRDRAHSARANQIPSRPGVWDQSEKIDSHLSRMLTPYTAPKVPRGRQPKQLNLGI